ncbi:MAG: hypothetical protein ACRDS1_01025 [Pseudonocardiaceae bacterium]
MTPELRAYVAASRAAQGLPPTVEDPAILERVAAVFRLVAPPVESVKRRRGGESVRLEPGQ